MTRRGGLGRGLDALLPSEPVVLTEDREGVQMIAPAAIDPNPRQPRRYFDEGDIQELAASIQQLGVLQPVLVRRVQGRFELIAGERRVRAARVAGLDEIPAIEVDTDERGSMERALVENLHRSDLNPIEEASAYRELMEDAGFTQEELGRRVGRSRAVIANTLRLLDLPTAIQRLLVEGRITAGHGRALLGLQNNPFQTRLAGRVAQEGLSVRETEELVRKYESMTGSVGTATPAGRRMTPPEALEAQRALAGTLQTRVRVEVGKRKGRIVVDFVSLEELERLTRLITGSSDAMPENRAAPDQAFSSK